MTPQKPEKPRVTSARFVASAPQARLLPPPVGVEIAFAGRSNVGKSTLLNALMQRKGLARTSSTPGCTRELVLFEVTTPDGAVATFVDLPGYGYAKRSKAERKAWGAYLEEYLLGRPTLRTVVLLVDARRGIEEDDQGLLDLVASAPSTSRREVATVIVATKLDKISAAARKPALDRLSKAAGRRILGFTETERRTHDEVFRQIRHAAGIPTPPASPAQGIDPAASGPVSSRSQSP